MFSICRLISGNDLQWNILSGSKKLFFLFFRGLLLFDPARGLLIFTSCFWKIVQVFPTLIHLWSRSYRHLMSHIFLHPKLPLHLFFFLFIHPFWPDKLSFYFVFFWRLFLKFVFFWAHLFCLALKFLPCQIIYFQLLSCNGLIRFNDS